MCVEDLKRRQNKKICINNWTTYYFEGVEDDL